MSLGGFLAYYFASDAGYVQLDRCKYANNLDSECMAQYPTTDDIVAFKGYEKTCGNPKVSLIVLDKIFIQVLIWSQWYGLSTVSRIVHMMIHPTIQLLS
jgi:hypothetical protein